jgi:hypothetical protein
MSHLNEDDIERIANRQNGTSNFWGVSSGWWPHRGEEDKGEGGSLHHYETVAAAKAQVAATVSRVGGR